MFFSLANLHKSKSFSWLLVNWWKHHGQQQSYQGKSTSRIICLFYRKATNFTRLHLVWNSPAGGLLILVGGFIAFDRSYNLDVIGDAKQLSVTLLGAARGSMYNVSERNYALVNPTFYSSAHLRSLPQTCSGGSKHFKSWRRSTWQKSQQLIWSTISMTLTTRKSISEEATLLWLSKDRTS